MTKFNRIPDAEERRRALDPACSFIVQAPAGSGKTGLLIQRYLRLLACVDEPEEVVAITFTRKAAAEMRERVVTALEQVNARKPDAPDRQSPFEQLTDTLARDVLQRDQSLHWRILDNPARLRIQTIDSLCAVLTRQMPVLSTFGSQPETTDDASGIYLQAARATLALLNGCDAIADDLEQLLDHLDNDTGRLTGLLVDMLARRDHWLRHVHGGTEREALEASLDNLRRNTVVQTVRLVPTALQDELLALACYAAANLIAEQRTDEIVLCDGLDALPDDVAQWCGIADLLLTGKDEWRRKVDRRQGFPTGNSAAEKETAKAWKARFSDLRAKLADNDALREALQAVRQLPPPAYSDEQWQILAVIARLLPCAVAELQLVFQSMRQVDFSEVSQRAVQALGEPDNPTDLALALDYKIRHVLIDEFQDTSISQFQLIEKLIGGWELNDGRTLFAVGDPMQSIYRFREAEVGLFLQARRFGIGHIELQPVTLSSNFRSQRGIVDWVNDAFGAIMPPVEDIAMGAVAYTPSFAVHEAHDGRAVTLHPLFENNRAQEAIQVVEVIVQTQRRIPSGSIAILVRNRSHLSEIVQLLKTSQIGFRAVDIDPLDKKPIIQDLLMLTRALLNIADRIAWVSVLRAPWCGLTLADLQVLTSMREATEPNHCVVKPATVWSQIRDESHWSGVSADGITRLRRLQQVFAQCIPNRNRETLRSTVEAAWLALGGPAYSQNGVDDNVIFANALEDVAIFLDYLEQHDTAGTIADWQLFEDGLARLYASADRHTDDRLQIMTIHKSKGLEFDTVLIPGLGYSPKSRTRGLLQWAELPRNRDVVDACQAGMEKPRETDLFLAPIHETGTDTDRMDQWLSTLEQNKENLESARLLYVAATRAKKCLHLFGHVSVTEKDTGERSCQPRSGSLLSRLWPVVRQIYSEALSRCETQDVRIPKVDGTYHTFDQSVLRLTTDWQLPAAPAAVAWKPAMSEILVQDQIEYSWAGEMARHIGTVVHRTLQQIAQDGLDGWDVQRIDAMQTSFRQGLLQSGLVVDAATLVRAVERIRFALINTLSDERGRWILRTHKHARSELRLTRQVDGNIKNYVIDRTFCDEADRRWIIDYKTSGHEGAGLAEFLDREVERYKNQLNSYANIMRQSDDRQIFLGLYFPLLSGWRAWAYQRA